MQILRHHLGRTYVIDASGPSAGPWHGRFVVKGEEDGHRPGATSWHDLSDDFASAEEATAHADAVARQYIATFAEQA